MAQIKAHKKPAGHKRKVREIRIVKAKNGFSVHHEMELEQRRVPGGGMMTDYGPPNEPAVFGGKKAHKQARDHVASLMSDMHDAEPDAGGGAAERGEEAAEGEA